MKPAAQQAIGAELEGVPGVQIRKWVTLIQEICGDGDGVVDTMLGIPRSPGTTPAQAAQRFAQRIPLRRVGQPRDVAAVVAFLASADAAHVTGAGWLIDGGQTLQSWANAPHAVAYPKQHATRDDRSPDPPWRYP